MEIVSTTDRSRAGNDCYIYESVSLVMQFDMYAVIVCQRVTGWAEREEVSVQCVTRDYAQAKKAYKHCGGIL
jgi:hypothetical protein